MTPDDRVLTPAEGGGHPARVGCDGAARMTPLVPELTTREEQVLLAIGDGMGLREIADRMGLSWRMVRRDRDRARDKLGAPTTTAAVVIVVRLRAGELAG